MINPNSIIRFILPLGLLYAAFTFLGPMGGFLVFVIFLLVWAYLNRAIIYQNLANRKYHNGNFEGALSDLKTAVSYDPKQVRIRGSYAYLLLKLGHTEEAAIQIDEALKDVKLEVDKNTLRMTKALVLWKQGNVDEAINELVDLQKVYETTNTYATLGFLYIEKGDIDKALEFNLEAKDYNSSNAIILDNLGTSYLLLEDYEKAFEIYQDLMKLKPKFPEAFYNYARVLDKMDDLEKALYMVRHSLTLRFWNTSTIGRKQVEDYLSVLEAKEITLRPAKKVFEDASENNKEEEEESEKTEDTLS